MTSAHKLSVLDASVIINLLATEELDRILSVYNYTCIVPEQVFSEIKRSPITRMPYSARSHPILASRYLSVEKLSGNALDMFVDLVSGPATSRLDDGEAAAIALAFARCATLVIDERKARRIIKERYPSIVLHRSGDLICNLEFIRNVGQEISEECRRKAIKFGRANLELTQTIALNGLR